MEDASITELDLGDGNSLFGVFDGHGGISFVTVGTEVSLYVKKYYPKLLTSQELYKNGKF